MSPRHLLRLAYSLPGVPLYAAALRRKAERCNSLAELVDLSTEFQFRALTVRPTQVRSEIVAFLDVVRQAACRTIVEVGTARGGTLFLLSHVAPAGSVLVSVDLPQGPNGIGYPPWKRPLFRRFGRAGTKLIPVQVDSHRPEVPGMIRRLVGNRPLDLLFIDGDHSYDGVKQDFEQLSPLLRPGGLVAFHDIVPGPPERVGDVPRFWSEVRHSGATLELVHDWAQEGFGIGLIRLGSEEPVPNPAEPPGATAAVDEPR